MPCLFSQRTPVPFVITLGSRRQYGLALALLCTFASQPARAQLLNGGFETGGFTSWLAIGKSDVIPSLGNIKPDTGGFFCRMRTEVAKAVPASAVESFIGLAPGALNALGNPAIQGSAIKQTLTVTAGATLTVRYNFLTRENIPDLVYNDFAFFAVVGPGSALTRIANTQSAPFVPATGGIFYSMTNWRTFTHTFAAGGTVTLGFGVMDMTDDFERSALLVDSITLGGVLVSEPGGSTDVAEGGTTDTLSVVLSQAPTANVTVTPSGGTQLTVAPASLIFTPANWNTPQTLTVSAIDDAVAEGPHTGTVTFTVASTDANYNGFTVPPITVNITDNDAGGVVFTQPGGSTTVTEGGVSGGYTAKLTSVPTANVTITMVPDAQVLTAPATLTFTPANWNVPQVVTVTAVDDSVIEGRHVGFVGHTAASTDTKYNNLPLPTLVININDNDFGANAGEGAYNQTGIGGEGGFRGAASAKSVPVLLGPFAHRSASGYLVVIHQPPQRALSVSAIALEAARAEPALPLATLLAGAAVLLVLGWRWRAS